MVLRITHLLNLRQTIRLTDDLYHTDINGNSILEQKYSPPSLTLAAYVWPTMQAQNIVAFSKVRIYRSTNRFPKCPTNFRRLLQLWAHINVENPFNWPHGKSYCMVFIPSCLPAKAERKSSDMNGFFLTKKWQFALGKRQLSGHGNWLRQFPLALFE